MGQDHHLGDAWAIDGCFQNGVEPEAGIDRAFAIVDVVEHVAARRPGERHRCGIDARIVNELCETIDGFGMAVVESRHENQHVLRSPACLAKPRHNLLLAKKVGLERDEGSSRIGLLSIRPHNETYLTSAGGGDGYDDVVEADVVPTLSGISERGIVGGLACGGN